MRDRFQVHVLAVEYPGYGICPGAKCDERAATESALTAFRFAREVLRWPLERILFIGRSVGAAPAITLAVEHAVKGLCLITPFLSVREACRDALGPICYLIEERFPNKDHMPMIRSPVLLIHGQKDQTIPYRHGKELFESCRSRKRLVSPPEMDHNSNLLQNRANFVAPMLEFFSLPTQGLEDMHVPSWAFDKRLSPFYLQRLVKQPKPQGLDELLAACTTCTACGKCAGSGGPEMLTAGTTNWDDHVVEETITGAIEHVLGHEKGTVWTEGRAGQGPTAVKDTSTTVLTYKNALGQELPLPPSDDAVPVIPHATVRRYPGRLVDPQMLGGPITPPRSTDRSTFGPATTPPQMPYRPKLAPPKAVMSPKEQVPSDTESVLDFEDFSETAAETTLIRI